MSDLPSSNPDQQVRFTPEVLDRTVLSFPLLNKLREEQEADRRQVHAVLIDVNLMHVDGRAKARERAMELVQRAVAEAGKREVRASTRL